jgi:hypothetical protein
MNIQSDMVPSLWPDQVAAIKFGQKRDRDLCQARGFSTEPAADADDDLGGQVGEAVAAARASRAISHHPSVTN